VGPFSAFAEYAQKVNYAGTHTSITDISNKRDTLNSRDASNSRDDRDSWGTSISRDTSNRRDASNRKETSNKRVNICSKDKCNKRDIETAESGTDLYFFRIVGTNINKIQ
jgi:hypothetical protein